MGIRNVTCDTGISIYVSFYCRLNVQYEHNTYPNYLLTYNDITDIEYTGNE